MWTRDKLLVARRPNVEQRDWRPWHEVNQKRRTNPPSFDMVDRLRARLAARRRGELVEPIDRSDAGELVPLHPELLDENGRPKGDAADWHHRTYTWACRCGRTHTRRHERISDAWQRYNSDTRMTIVVLDQDL